jgi:AraC-like DNA-binding protein
VTAIHFDLIDARGDVVPPGSAHLPPERLTVRSPRLVDEMTRWIAERAMDTRAGMSLPREIEDAANSMLRGLLIKLDHNTPPDSDAQPGEDTGAWRQLTAYIQEHLHELGGVETLAAKAGYTRSHFSRLFKAQTGLSPRDYVIAARINLAKELLRSTALTVTEIAARCGYGDVYTFSKQFKQRAAVSPSTYRVRSDR